MQAISVNHVTSSLHYPQSNELAEKYVQIVKYLFNKTKEEGKISTNVWWFIAIPTLQLPCSCQCRFYKEDVLGLLANVQCS